MRFNFIPRRLFATSTGGGGGTPPNPQNSAQAQQQAQQQLNQQMQEFVKLHDTIYKKGTTIAEQAYRQAVAYGTITTELDIMNGHLEAISFKSDYIFNSLKEQTDELKNQNVLLNIGKSAFSKLTSIASDVNYFQKGTNDLTDKQFKKLGESLEIQKDHLDYVKKRLESATGEYKYLQDINNLVGKSDEASEKKLKYLQKEQALYNAAKGTLELMLPALETELKFSKDIAKTRESLGGLTAASAKILNKYGSELAQFLDLNDAVESVEKYNKKLIDDALKSEKVFNQLHHNELLRIQKEAELESATTPDEREKILKEIEAINERDYNTRKKAIDGVNTLNNKFKSLGVFIEGLGSGLKRALTDPVVILGFIADSLFKGSKNLADFQKQFGISYINAYKLNAELDLIGNNILLSSKNQKEFAENLTDSYITGEKLKLSLSSLSAEMGAVVDYGDEALVSMTNLTGKLGLSNKEASQLVTLTRFQSKNTEQVLDDISKAVTAQNKLGKTAILLKDVFKDIANASRATAISIGNTPTRLAEAATIARQLGTTLQGLEGTATALLQWETSIENELKAELLTGKEMNLERARAAALTNDMKTLGEEIANNQEIINAFTSNNRLAQDAIAATLGKSREELGEMLYLAEARNIGEEGVRKKYGEQAYEALKARNAQERFADSVTKLKDALSSIVQLFSPILDAVSYLASGIANIASTIPFLGPIFSIIALLYLPAMVKGIWSGVAGLGKMITQLPVLSGLFKSTAAASNTIPTPSPQGARIGKSFPAPGSGGPNPVNNINQTARGFQIGPMLQGAIAILAFAGAMYVAALAFQEFADVKWPDVALGVLGMVGLAAAAYILGKAKGEMVEGAIAVAILSTALIPASVAFSLLAKVGWEKIAAAGAAMVGMAYAVQFLAKGSKEMIIGAAAVAILGAALIPFALTMKLIGELDINSVLAATAGLILFTGAIFGLGALISTGLGGVLFAAGVSGFIMLGFALATLGAGMKIVVESGQGIADVFKQISELDASKLKEIAPSLKTIGDAMLYLGTGSILGAIGNFLGGDPIKKIEKLSQSGEGLVNAANSIQSITNSIAQFNTGLSSLDMSKLDIIGPKINDALASIDVSKIDVIVAKINDALASIVIPRLDLILTNIDTSKVDIAVANINSALANINVSKLDDIGSSINKINNTLNKISISALIDGLAQLSSLNTELQNISGTIQALDTSLIKLSSSFTNFDANRIILVSSALKMVGEGLKSLSGPSIMESISSFLSEDPVEKLERIAATSDKILTVAVALQSMSSALLEVSSALNNLDTSKLESLEGFKFNNSTTAVTSSPIIEKTTELGLASTIRPLSIQETASSPSSIIKGRENQLDISSVTNAISELKTALNNISNRPVKLLMDGKEFTTRQYIDNNFLPA